MKTLGEIIDALVTYDVEAYVNARLTVTDEIIAVIKRDFPNDYAKFDNKEVEYQEALSEIQQWIHE